MLGDERPVVRVHADGLGQPRVLLLGPRPALVEGPPSPALRVRGQERGAALVLAEALCVVYCVCVNEHLKKQSRTDRHSVSMHTRKSDGQQTAINSKPTKKFISITEDIAAVYSSNQYLDGGVPRGHLPRHGLPPVPLVLRRQRHEPPRLLAREFLGGDDLFVVVVLLVRVLCGVFFGC